jgi:cell division protein FtsZ
MGENSKNAVIKIIGVGGAGGNTVNNIIQHFSKKIESGNYDNMNIIAANTDSQVLRRSKAEIKIPLGEGLTRGLGAGGDPEVGKKAALESIETIKDVIKGTDLLIITGGMGGGTGTGAIPVIAEVAKKMGIMVMAIVTKPFKSEGEHKSRIAEQGISELKKNIDSIIVIPNEKLVELYSNSTSKEAYQAADNVLIETITGITQIIVTPGHVNVDFADIKSIIENSGTALVGIGKGKGERRHIEAIKRAVNFPLIESADIQNSKGIIVYFKVPDTFKMIEQNEVMDYVIKRVANSEVKIKYGETFDETIEDDEVHITLIAAGFGYDDDIIKDNIEAGDYYRNYCSREKNDFEHYNDSENKLKPAYLRRRISILD